MSAPVASGWSGRRLGLAPTGKAPPCHGARGRRRVDDCGIDDRADGYLQSLGLQMPLHLVEQLPPQIVLLEQMAEAAHRRFVGHRLAGENNSGHNPPWPRTR